MPLNKKTISTSAWRQRFEQQANWTHSLRQYLLPRAGLQAGSKLLEVGCGPGVILDEIAGQDFSTDAYSNLPDTFDPAPSRLKADTQLHGLDICLDYLQYYRKKTQLAHLIQADAHQLPYPEGTFDLVVCHFLLLWVRDAFQVVSEMKRVCRRGGSVLALAEPDYGGRVDFPLALREAGRLQAFSLRAQDADPEMGRKLGHLFSEAGLGEIELGVLGGQWSGTLGESERQLEWQVLEHDLQGLATEQDLHTWQEIDRQAWASGSRVLFVPTFYAWGKC